MASNQRNKITWDFASSPDLKALFSGWEVGKEYSLNVKFQLDELTPDGASCTIQEITSEEPDAEGEPTSVEPDASEPVMAVMSAGPSGEKEPYVAP
jgi:hypothetical protein